MKKECYFQKDFSPLCQGLLFSSVSAQKWNVTREMSLGKINIWWNRKYTKHLAKYVLRVQKHLNPKHILPFIAIMS